MKATMLYLDRRNTEALATVDRALAIDDRDRGAWEVRSRILFQMGRGADAVAALGQMTFADHAAALREAARKDGVQAALRLLLEITNSPRGRDTNSWRRAPWRVLLGETDAALDELQHAYRFRNFNLVYLGVDPVYDPLRSQPRFQQLLLNMGLGDTRPAQ
jgi:hypothetical protein